MQTESIAPVTAEQAWNKAAAMLRLRLGDQVFESWFGSMRVDTEHSAEEVVCLSVANTFLVGRVTQPLYFPTLVDIVRLALGKKEIAVRVIARPRGNGLSKEDPETVWKRPERDIFGAVPPVKASKSTSESVVPAPVDKVVFEKPSAVMAPVPLPETKPTPSIEPVEENLSTVDLLIRRLFQRHRKVTIDMLAEMVASVYGISVEGLKAHNRSKLYVRPRKILMYLSTKLTSNSYPEIGRRLGGRNHSTVYVAVQDVTNDRKSDGDLDSEIRCHINAIERNRPH